LSCSPQATEESAIRASAGAELQELRERLTVELEEERAQLKAGHEQEIKNIREKGLPRGWTFMSTRFHFHQVLMKVCNSDG